MCDAREAALRLGFDAFAQGNCVGAIINLKGTGNLNPNAPTGGDIVVTDTFAAGTGTTRATTPATGTTNTPSPLAGEGRGEGASRTTAATATSSTFPGQGLAHRSDRANEVAQNTLKNKHLNGGIPGGEHGADNSNAGGNGNAAGTSNNPGNTGGTGGGGSNAGGNGGGNNNGGGAGQGNGAGGNTNGGGGGGPSAGSGQGGNGREFIYFYHPDHLGSTGYVTDEKALRYEHIAYFPFGETWVQESNATWRVPYQFTSKEMDQETGLYYFGARYYDPRTSVWVSADPILGDVLGNKKEGAEKLPLTLALFTYGRLNPIRYMDPDGRDACGEGHACVWQGLKGTVKVVGGGAAVVGGVGVCTSGVGCAVGVPAAIIGGSEAVQGSTLIAGAIQGVATDGINVVKEALESAMPQIGGAVYDVAALATTVAGAALKVPAIIGKSDGIDRVKSMFGVTARAWDNRKELIGGMILSQGANRLNTVREAGQRIWDGAKDLYNGIVNPPPSPDQSKINTP